MSLSKTQKAAAAEYSPLTDKGEYMNPRMLDYFREKLLAEKAERTIQIENHRLEKRSSGERLAEIVERASNNAASEPDDVMAAKNKKLVATIDAALKRIDNGTYGICLDTGEDIPVARLDARPWAMYTIDAQEKRERNQKLRKDDLKHDLDTI